MSSIFVNQLPPFDLFISNFGVLVSLCVIYGKAYQNIIIIITIIIKVTLLNVLIGLHAIISVVTNFMAFLI